MGPIEILIKLVSATILGGIVGLERELHDQPAGLRTHIIVCVGSALIMIVSLEMSSFSRMADPSRIAAQVVTGIGFLGAGAIIRFGASVRGLTTAACLWTVAAIGLAVGANMYLPAIIVTIIVLLAIFVFDKLEKVIFRGKTYKKMIVTARDVPGLIGKMETVVEVHEVIIKNVGINKLLAENKVQLTVLVKVPGKFDLEKLSKEISAIDGIEQFEIN